MARAVLKKINHSLGATMLEFIVVGLFCWLLLAIFVALTTAALIRSHKETEQRQIAALYTATWDEPLPY
jgi:hypothetical protein